MIEVHFIENYYSLGWYWLTIHDARATKDQAIKELLKITGHSLEDLIFFGDNAKDELKEYADEIIGLNEEDSIVKYIIEKFNNI